MANQYSITVSDESDRILKDLRSKGYKMSQLIDVAIKTLNRDALMRLITHERILDSRSRVDEE